MVLIISDSHCWAFTISLSFINIDLLLNIYIVVKSVEWKAWRYQRGIERAVNQRRAYNTMAKWKKNKRIIASYTSPYWRSGISSTSVRNSVFSRVERSERVERRWISLTSRRNPRSSIRTSASTCFFRFNLKTKHVDFIHSHVNVMFTTQCSKYTLI